MPLQPDLGLPDPAAGATLVRFANGFKAIAQGPRLALRHNDILLWSLATALLYCAIWVAVLATAARFDQEFVRWLTPSDGPQWWIHALYLLAKWALYAVFWLTAVVATAPIALPLCAPALGMLAEKVEAHVAGRGPPAVRWATLLAEAVRGAVRGLLISVVLVAGDVAIWVACTLLSLIFAPLGLVLSLTVAPAWHALGLAALATSFALENRRCRLADQLAFLQEQRAVLIGFGLAAQALAWMPLLMPFVVIAATALVVRLHAHGHVRYPDDGT